MIRHVVWLSVTCLLVVSCIFYPFFPGEYDSLAVPLSAMAQLLGIGGVLLVPLGAAWLAYEVRSHRRDAGGRSGTRARYWLALASLGASIVVGIFLSLAAWVNVGPSLGFGAIALCAWSASRLAPKLKAMRSADSRAFNVAPLYLVVVPGVALISRFALIGPASEFSRNRAIENSATLIGDIERYRDVNGRYPLSLLSVWKDYKPGVIGIDKYHYEPSGDAYNVYFEQIPHLFGTREFVVYNRRDEQEMTSHAMDLLELTPAQLAVMRGYYAVHDASRPHWKRFLFD